MCFPRHRIDQAGVYRSSRVKNELDAAMQAAAGDAKLFVTLRRIAGRARPERWKAFTRSLLERKFRTVALEGGSIHTSYFALTNGPFN